MSEYQDLVNHLSLENTRVNLVPSLWNKINPNVLKAVQCVQNWNTFKYLNDDGTLNINGIRKVNCHKGGIYVYYISPEIIPERQRILMYIGRAHKTANENLRARIRSYYKFFCNEDISRPQIRQLFYVWGHYIYCSFIELDDNDTIDIIENELINALLPPCNSSIPNVTISAAARSAL